MQKVLVYYEPKYACDSKQRYFPVQCQTPQRFQQWKRKSSTLAQLYCLECLTGRLTNWRYQSKDSTLRWRQVRSMLIPTHVSRKIYKSWRVPARLLVRLHKLIRKWYLSHNKWLVFRLVRPASAFRRNTLCLLRLCTVITSRLFFCFVFKIFVYTVLLAGVAVAEEYGGDGLYKLYQGEYASGYDNYVSMWLVA